MSKIGWQISLQSNRFGRFREILLFCSANHVGEHKKGKENEEGSKKL